MGNQIDTGIDLLVITQHDHLKYREIELTNYEYSKGRNAFLDGCENELGATGMLSIEIPMGPSLKLNLRPGEKYRLILEKLEE